MLATAAHPGYAAAQSRAGNSALWVRFEHDSVAVHWMSDSVEASTLTVRAGDRVVAHRVTAPATSHRATFALANLDTVDISFGPLGDERPAFTTTVSLQPPTRPASTFAQPDTLFILGDTHGAFDHLLAGLLTAGIIDERLRWKGGRSRVVFAGDLTDRGPDVLRMLWFVYDLERQARTAGGDVYVLLGNHEIMVMLADLRYVHPKELDIAERFGVRYDELLDPRTSLLGRWLASRPAVVQFGDVVIAHGGVAPEYARLPIAALNDTLAHYLSLAPRRGDTTIVDSVTAQARDDFFWGERSVFWHRDYVRLSDVTAEVDTALRLWSARVMVLGHTPVARIGELHGGRVIAAHTPRFGAELLMLVRRDDQLERWRIVAHQPPERF